MVGLSDDFLSCFQCVAQDEVGEVSAVECDGAEKQGFLFGTDAQGHAAVVLDCWSGHGVAPLSYAFKVYV